MRLTLVILYFAAIYYILRPAPLLDFDVAAPVPPPVSQTGLPAPPPIADAQPTPAMPEPSLPPVDSGPIAATAEALDPDEPAAATPGTIAEAEEEAGEQRTSTQAPELELDMRDARMERRIQAELVRLACLTGQPEKRWGARSQAALKRFTQRTKAKGETLDAALLRMLRRYPANYCKLCKPGQDACKIDAITGDPKKSELVPEMIPDGAPTALPSYLPPWMTSEMLAEAEETEYRTDAAIVGTKPKKRVQRRHPTRKAKRTPRRAGSSRR
jgi:hypothetical protein